MVMSRRGECPCHSWTSRRPCLLFLWPQWGTRPLTDGSRQFSKPATSRGWRVTMTQDPTGGGGLSLRLLLPYFFNEKGSYLRNGGFLKARYLSRSRRMTARDVQSTHPSSCSSPRIWRRFFRKDKDTKAWEWRIFT